MPAKPLPLKELTCSCGHTFTSTQSSNWCIKCGKQVFYHPEDARKNRFTRLYIQVILVLVIGVAAYLFVEMILTPVLQLRQGG